MREKNSMRVVFSWYSGARKSAFYFSLALCSLRFAVSPTRSNRESCPRLDGSKSVPMTQGHHSSYFSASSVHSVMSVVFEYRNAGNKLDRLPALADELVRLGVNLVFAVPAPAARSSEERYNDHSHRFSGRF